MLHCPALSRCLLQNVSWVFGVILWTREFGKYYWSFLPMLWFVIVKSKYYWSEHTFLLDGSIQLWMACFKFFNSTLEIFQMMADIVLHISWIIRIFSCCSVIRSCYQWTLFSMYKSKIRWNDVPCNLVSACCRLVLGTLLVFSL